MKKSRRSASMIGHRKALVFSTAAVLAGLAMLAFPSGAHADWFGRTLQDIAEWGGAAPRSSGELDKVARIIVAQPPDRSTATLAARLETSGHWTFQNRDGERFTAASEAEMARLASVLVPASHGEARLTVVLTEGSARTISEAVVALPDARLQVLARGRVYPIELDSAGAALVQVRRHVSVPIARPEPFQEALFLLERRVDLERLRVLALDRDGPAQLAERALPTTERAAFAAEPIAPDALAQALSNIPRQTIVLVGRLDGADLVYRSGDGAEHAMAMDPVRRAAITSDIDILVLESKTPRQPGRLNWLWQRAQVSGLDTALRRPHFADMLNALGEVQGGFRFATDETFGNRVAFRVEPRVNTEPGGINSTIGSIVAEIASETAGAVFLTGIQGYFKSQSRARELERRILPGLPSVPQFAYLGALLLGAFGWSVVRTWWARLWPPEARGDYASSLGFGLAHGVRMFVFGLLFLPLVGPIAALWSLVRIAANVVLVPYRAMTRDRSPRVLQD